MFMVYSLASAMDTMGVIAITIDILRTALPSGGASESSAVSGSSELTAGCDAILSVFGTEMALSAL